jgi:hypothetical protein
MADKIASKLVQLPARQIHALRTNRGIQRRELKTEPLRVHRLYTRFVAGSKKSSKPLVPERHDHQNNRIA